MKSPPILFKFTLCILCVGMLSGCGEEKQETRGESADTSEPLAAQSTGENSGIVAAQSFGGGGAGPALNLEVGAGYNEQIANINNSLVAKSGVRWVRAYVNLPRNYWIFGAPILQPPPSEPIYPINAILERNIIQEGSSVSTDADTLAIAALDQLINTKTVFVLMSWSSAAMASVSASVLTLEPSWMMFRSRIALIG